MTQPAPSSPVREGDVLAGKYRVEKVLGVGGMGVVVAATHLQLDQKVALKFVLPDAVQSQEVLGRFAREARAAVKLKSEHVARVLDVGTLETGAPYMVMEYLEGRDLAAEVDSRGPLPAGEVADFVLQACEALAEAHALGIVHRDLKPQNMFLTRRVDGRPLVKILDFGISKVTPQAGENMSLTATSAVMGSPNYMSPEQLRSAKGVDARTDIWALGVVMYELLAGQVPFVASSVTELCAMVLQDKPRLLSEIRDIPAGLAEIVARCLEKDPNARFQSVANLAHALEGFAQSHEGVGQRMLAVARESGARGLVPNGARSGSSSGQIALASGTGKTSVSWAATELATNGKKKGARTAVIGAVSAAVLLMGGIGVWRLGRTPAPPPPATLAIPPQPAEVSPALSTSPVASAVPIVVPLASAPAVAGTTASPPGPDTKRPIAAPRPPAAGPRPTTTKRNPDQDTPDERN